MMLNADLNVDGDDTTIRLAGELDIASAPDVAALAKTAVCRAEMRTLVIDLTEVAFVDFTGIGALIDARNSCRDHGAELRLQGVTPRVRRVLTLAGLIEWFGLDEGDAGQR